MSGFAGRGLPHQTMHPFVPAQGSRGPQGSPIHQHLSGPSPHTKGLKIQAGRRACSRQLQLTYSVSQPSTGPGGDPGPGGQAAGR